MSGFSGNPHHQHPSIRNTHTNDGLIEATLALAHEQRTANLIAIWQTGDIKSNGETFGITGEKRMELFTEIAGRLGFKP